MLKDQLLVRSLDAYAAFLPSAFDKENFAFYGTTLSGTPEQQARWKRAVDFTVGALGDDVSKLYVAQLFPARNQGRGGRAGQERHRGDGPADRQARVDGAGDQVKAHAKLAAFTPKIGYPEPMARHFGPSRSTATPSVTPAREPVRLRLQPRQARQADRERGVGHDADDDQCLCQFGMVEIVFPAAILQPPFFDPKADPAINYGGIGAVIGHEFSHHFDDQGAKYDPNGQLTDWWTPADVARSTSRLDKLVKQYDAYEPLPGHARSGRLTMGENIADLAGLTVAHDAYKVARREGCADHRRDHRRSALLSRLGPGLAPQLSRRRSSPASVDRPAFPGRAAGHDRPQPGPVVRRVQRPARADALPRSCGSRPYLVRASARCCTKSFPAWNPVASSGGSAGLCPR